MDLACGTGVLCDILYKNGIEAAGMDFSEGMIALAREKNQDISFEVADMITFCPDEKYDLVTCTGDALNHIMELSDVEKIFRNIAAYTADGGYFIFDILKEDEVQLFGPIDLDFSETVKAQFTVSRDEQNVITLTTTVYENGSFSFEEKIREIIHDPVVLCEMLIRNNFHIIQCSNQFLEGTAPGTSWHIVAKKC